MIRKSKKSIALFAVILVASSLIGCSSSNNEVDNSEQTKTESSSETGNKTVTETPTPTESTAEPSSDTEPESANDETDPLQNRDENGKLLSGDYVLPCGMELTFSDNVRNDKTDNWRLSTTASGQPISDYAMEYYKNMFSNDDEVHAIWNANLNTTTCIKAMSGCLFVDTYEYVKGEEHDADLLFTGTPLTSKILNLKTGEPFEQ